jgi:hypothetical protein
MRYIITILLLTMPIFGQLKQETPFNRMFDAGRIAEKKAIWRGLTKAEQVEARRANFEWGIGALDLNTEQVGYLNRFASSLPTATFEQVREFQAEAMLLFPKQKAYLLFGSIGPYRDSPCFSIIIGDPQPFGNCPCNRGSSFNMSCESDCESPTGCTETQDGCGFAWLFACNGSCRVSGVS